MWADREQFVSIPMLLAGITLIVYSSHVRCWSVLGYVLLVFLFLFFSILFALSLDSDVNLAFLRGPVGSAILVVGVCGASVSLGAHFTERVVGSAPFLLAVSAAAVLASPLLYPIYVNPPPDVLRFSGFFANPNEAGIVCVTGAAFSLNSFVISRRWIYLTLAAFFSVAVLATFSKASMVALLALCSYALIASKASRRAVALLLVALISGAAATLLIIGTEADLLAESQLERIFELSKILALQIDEETSTNRIYVWHAALLQITDNVLFLGSGLGSMRAIEGALMEEGTWRGVHNFWLMLIGEGGALVLAPFVFFFVRVAWQAARLQRHRIAIVGYLMAFTFDTFSSHNIFELRFHGFLLGLSLAVIHLWASQPRDTRAKPGRVFIQHGSAAN
jgi:O-antigen ligase